MAISRVCGTCGHPNRAEARFCARCGVAVAAMVEMNPPADSSSDISLQATIDQAIAAIDQATAQESTDMKSRSARSGRLQAAKLERYHPLRHRAKWVQLVFGALILASVAAIGLDGAEIELMDRVAAGQVVTTTELEANERRQAAVGILLIGLWIASAVVFIRWFSAAYRNLGAFGLAPRFKTGWAIGSWFVPFLNLWRPKQIANDIWRGSDPELPSHVDPWSRPVPTVLGLWWAAWVIGLFVGRGALRSSFSATTAEEFRTAAIVDIVGLTINIAAAVLAVVFVRQATARQEARAARVRDDAFVRAPEPA